MAKVIRGERKLVAAKLLGDPSSHLLQGRFSQIGVDQRQCMPLKSMLQKIEAFNPLRVERPHLVLPCFCGGQNADHTISLGTQRGQVAEEHFMVAKAIGRHQAIGKSPARVGNAQDALQNLLITRQLAEPGSMQAITSCLLSPVFR
ncbi:MAG: Uncharacterised protein [Cyanobium sp. ARS6]|nr:MAG: Uncharacterised protein [Cyanobium sp. ARS6]